MEMPFVWKTSRRSITFERPFVMGILNVTPDSFSDGGRYAAVDDALKHAETMIADGADIIDVGGESTRPGSDRVPLAEEIGRVLPVIESIAKRFDIPISIDTTRSEVARSAADAGAEIVNDISGLRFDEKIAAVAAGTGTGLVLMHSRGDFGSMHSQPPVDDILAEVRSDFQRAIAAATSYGVGAEQIVLDVGIGFGKTLDQNLWLIAKLDKLVEEFHDHPLLVGTSRKSFIGKILGDAPADRRLAGSLATAAIAVWNGAMILRVHDVSETVETLRIVSAVRASLV